MDKNRLKIAFITMGVKLPGETMGYTRFASLAQIFAEHGFDAELITTGFQHWSKQQRNLAELDLSALTYKVSFIAEPGYKRNVDPLRIYSHHVAAKNLRQHLTAHGSYDAIYAEVPPNNVAKVAGNYAKAKGIPFIIDVNDLWPEAMKMVFDIPPLSTIAYWPMARDARAVYRMANAIVGTSDEYRDYPYRHGAGAKESLTVYVGNELKQFDDAATAATDASADLPHKPADAFWLTYAGTLGESYDLTNVLYALAILPTKGTCNVQLILAGDGPKRAELEQQAAALGIDSNVKFLGFLPYASMAQLLARSDILINSFAPKAPQSVVNKIADYLAAGKPIINTAASPEMRRLLTAGRAGINIKAGEPEPLASAIALLAGAPKLCQSMGINGRALAEQSFDRKTSYRAIVEMIHRLLPTR
jgi:glycosyltransferase involved in cell wall biosynthesis